MFLEAIMVAVETCPQAAWLVFYELLQRRLGIPSEQTIVCGMAMGFPDPDHKVNAFTPQRVPLSDYVTFVEELKA